MESIKALRIADVVYSQIYTVRTKSSKRIPIRYSSKKDCPFVFETPWMHVKNGLISTQHPNIFFLTTSFIGESDQQSKTLLKNDKLIN